MPDINPAYFKALQKTLAGSPYFDLLSMELTDLKPGHCIFHLKTGPKHLQPWAVAHGGVLASVLDAAVFWAVFSLAADGVSMTTTDLMVKYLAPVPQGRELVVKGESINLGRTLGLGQARAEDKASGRLVATATSSLIRLDSPLPDQLARLPKKFVE